MQSLPSSPYTCAAVCIMPCKETVRWKAATWSFSVGTRSVILPPQRGEAIRPGAGTWSGENLWGGSYRREMVSYDATRHVARLFEACLRAHVFTNVEQTER